MNDTLARLVGQAEASLADLAKRTVDSVTAPIRIKSQEIASETLDAAARTAKTVVVQIVFGLIAAGMAVTAVIYALAALYDTLLPILGPIEAKLAMAGLFAAIAIVAVLAMAFWPKRKPSSLIAAEAPKAVAAEARRVMAETSAAAAVADAALPPVAGAETETPTSPAGVGVGLTDHFETIVGVLGEAGFRREQAGLRAGLALASQLKPMQIVSLALIGGFIAGLRYPTRR